MSPLPMRPVDRRTAPHLRCGICQEAFESDDATVYFDDERCHVDCVAAEEDPR